jgi:hypothetical protein
MTGLEDTFDRDEILSEDLQGEPREMTRETT